MKLSTAATPFTAWIEAIRLAKKTEQYYKNGLRLLSSTTLYDVALTDLSRNRIATIRFPGSSSNANNALRTLRRLLSWAKDEGFIKEVPKVKLLKERKRELLLGDAEEKALCAFGFQPLNEVIMIMRDMGMRNDREVLLMRWERFEWNKRQYFVGDSKTAAGRRWVPMSDRVFDFLWPRRKEQGWVFISTRTGGRVPSVAKQFRKARLLAGLAEDLVLYCARHDFGTYTMEQTGNMKLVMKVMGHESYQAALRYQHPSIDKVSEIMNLRRRA